MSAVIITPAGICECLYTEEVDLSAIGSLRVKRATRIVFDNRSGYWVVTDMADNELYRARSRQACLDWERVTLEQEQTLNHGGEISICLSHRQQ